MNSYMLKQHLSNSITLIQDILEDVGCHSITIKGKEMRFALPNHSNPTSGMLYIDTLYVKIWNELDIQGDIITLIKVLKNLSYGETIIYICNVLSIDFDPMYEPEQQKSKTEWIAPLLELCGKIKKQDSIELTLFDLESTYYHFSPHIQLCKEGITLPVQKQFHIGYDFWSQRILFPHRLWNGKEDDFVGIIGRTTNPYWEELNLPKYFPLKKYKKSYNLYGYWENTHVQIPENLSDLEKITYRTFKNTHRVIVYEAEKSVLKRASFHDYTGVALCGHSLSDEQVKILAGMDDVVEVIFALDNDVPEETMKEMCKRIFNKKTSYIIDKERNNPDLSKRILGPKDSPADCSEKDFYKLLKSRVVYKK